MFLKNRKGCWWRHRERKFDPRLSGSDRESAIADRRMRRGWDDQCRSRRRTKSSPWLDLRHLVKVISKVRAAAASRGRISWICRSDAPQRSRQTEACLADLQAGRPASHYHSRAVKWPVTRWTTARRVNWRVDWAFVAEQQSSRKQFVWCVCSSTGLSQDGYPDFKQTEVRHQNVEAR